MSANGTANGHVAAAPPVAEAAASSAAPSKIQPNDVGWQFVPQYYNFVNKQPHRLHCFYGKQSTFIHGEEGEEGDAAHGPQAINAKIMAINYIDCKVYIHSIDSQASAGGGIIVLVIGEMSNNKQPWRKFTQTFFLAEQPNGYFVLNDIFRYLREEDAEEDEGEGEAVEAIPVIAVDVHVDAPIESVPAESSKSPKTEKANLETVAETSQETEPAPVSAPSAPITDEVPAEAVAAAVPDKDVSPSEPPAVEEPAAPAPAAEEPTKAASPAPAPKAELPNGSGPTAEKASAPTPTPAPAPAAAPAQPAAPAKPAAPRSWAAMAAGNAAAKPAAAAAPAPTPAPAAAAPTPAAAPKKEEASAGSSSGRSQAYDNAMKVQTQHCFVKLPNWSLDNQSGGDVVDENTIKATAARFGDVNKVEIVKAKACAFVEFAKVDSARRAIATSLPQSQGGEGGVKISGLQGRLIFAGRLEKDERKPKGPNQSGQSSAQGQGQGQQGQGTKGGRTEQRGGARGGAGGQRGGGGRGRGGQGGQGGDRPAPQKA